VIKLTKETDIVFLRESGTILFVPISFKMVKNDRFSIFFAVELTRRDLVLGTCTCTRVVLEYKSRVLVLALATLSSKY